MRNWEQQALAIRGHEGPDLSSEAFRCADVFDEAERAEWRINRSFGAARLDAARGLTAWPEPKPTLPRTAPRLSRRRFETRRRCRTGRGCGGNSSLMARWP